MKEVLAHTEEQTSRIVGTVTQQLEKEIEAAAVSAATTSERNTRSAVDDLHKEVKAHLDQNRADFEKRQEETQHSVAHAAAGLEELARQLNSFKPASANIVGNLEGNLPKEVFQKL